MTVVNSRCSVVSLLVSAILVALCFSADAQQAKKVSRIGYLSQLDAARESARAEGYG